MGPRCSEIPEGGREGDTGGREAVSRWLVDSSRENVGPSCSEIREG